MSQVTIVANIHAAPDQVEPLKIEMERLIATTREEEGCLRYELHQDNDDSAHFVFFESWASRELWQTHMTAPHMQAYQNATNGMVEDLTVNEMTRIG